MGGASWRLGGVHDSIELRVAGSTSSLEEAFRGDGGRSDSRREITRLLGCGNWASFDGRTRRALDAVAAELGLPTRIGPFAHSSCPSAALEALRRDLDFAAFSGRLVVRRARRAFVSVPLEEPDDLVLGPEPVSPAFEELSVLLVDATGRPVPGQEYRAWLTDGRTAQGSMSTARAVTFPDLPSGRCTLAFPKIEERGDDAVPAEAEPVPLPVPAEKAEIVRVERRDNAAVHVLETVPAGSGITRVFQLCRREAQVIELEHFAQGSALLRLGRVPAAVAMQPDAPPLEGLDVLLAVLERAQTTSVDRMLITGHGASLSKERALGVKALLLGDAGRETWVWLAQIASIPEDVTALLQWLDAHFQYDCDPDAQVGGNEAVRLYQALSKFQRHYDAEVERGLFPSKEPVPIDGALDAETWGAMFDCIQRALRKIPTPPLPPPPMAHPILVVDDHHQTYPVLLAEIVAPGATGTERDAWTNQHWKDLDPLNPQKVIPHGGGWHPIYPGDVIVLEPTWDLQKLVAAGYDVRFPVPAPPEPPAPTTGSGPPALSAPGPRTFDCGARHPTSPFADAEARRAMERHVEVVFFDAPPMFHVCEDAGACTAKGCELYDPRQTELEYVEIGNYYDLFFDPRLSPTDAAESYRLFSDDGAYDRTLSRGLAKPRGRRLHLRFEGPDPALSYTLTQVLAQGYELTIASGFALTY